MEVGDNPLQTFVLVPPLGSSGFWSFLHQHLRDLDVCEILQLLNRQFKNFEMVRLEQRSMLLKTWYQSSARLPGGGRRRAVALC